MKSPLPIDSFLEEITQTLENKQNLVLIALPGAGKTTRVAPQLISSTPLKILMLQPRRIAARAAAERIAEENNWQLGREIGYRVRFEDCTSQESKIIIVTEALLMKELLKDPNLSNYGIIILDEFHERNLFTDAGLAALRELQQLQRPDLKILIMSATIDPSPLLNYLNPASLIQVPGKTFPVVVHYDQQSQQLNTGPPFIERVASKIFDVLKQEPQNILVFLPGVSEIVRVQKAVVSNPLWNKVNRQVFLLHGGLSLHEQHHVLQSPESKIILSTNIAETSLTIDGVDAIIDSGLARDLQWDQRRLYPWLKTSRISKASADQRKGRAGRQFAGHCHRLWTKLDEQSMQSFTSPEIINQDLTELVLTLIQLGVSDPNNFSWFEKPSPQSLERSIFFLFQLGLIANEKPPCELTTKGRWIQKIPLSPRLANLIYEGVRIGETTLAIQIAVILNERDPLGNENLETHLIESLGSDLILRIQALNNPYYSNGFRSHRLAIKQLHRITQNVSTNFKGFDFRVEIDVDNNVDNSKNNPPLQSNSSDGDLKNIINRLLIPCFSDRIAKRRRLGEATGLVVGQKGIELSSKSMVKDSEYFFCLSGHANEKNGNAIVDLAHPLPKNLILEQLNHDIVLKKEERFLPDKEEWMGIEQKYFRDLPIDEPVMKPLQISTDNLLSLTKKIFIEWKNSLPTLIQWYKKLELAQKIWPQQNWPNQDLWEDETIEYACMGEQSIKAVKEKNWPELFSYTLSKTEKALLTIDLPDAIKTPKGKSIPLLYDSSGTVSMELKIQDAFGWSQTPKVAQGKIKVRLLLLGPHGRPLQTTDDLESFWKGAYLEMRPSLKARYPRHSWPENPSF